MRFSPNLANSRRTLGRPRTTVFASLALSMTLLLSACGGGDDKNADPTAVPPPTEAPIPTLTADQVSVGALLDRIDAATASVTNTRKVEWSAPGDGSIGTPTPDLSVITEETIAPATRRVTTTTNGAVVDEQIAIDGAVFFKGTSVVSYVAPFVGPDTWVQVDPTVVTADSPVGQQVAYLTSPVGSPYGTVSDTMRARGATPSGQVDINGRACTVYAFVDTTSTGQRIDYTLSLDAQDLPCSLTQSAGGYANITLFNFNDPAMAITAPAASTPVSGTPEG